MADTKRIIWVTRDSVGFKKYNFYFKTEPIREIQYRRGVWLGAYTKMSRDIVDEMLPHINLQPGEGPIAISINSERLCQIRSLDGSTAI